MFCLFSPCQILAVQNIPTNKEIRALEQQVLKLINQERAKRKLSALILWDNLNDLAKSHSQKMAKGLVPFGHDGFEKRGAAIKAYQRHSSFGENVAYNYLPKDPCKTALEGWMQSKGHRDNILGDFNETGIGISVSPDGRYYFTQLFAKRWSKKG